MKTAVDKDHRSKTKGMKVKILLSEEGSYQLFTAGGKRRVTVDNFSPVMVNGEVILADGSRYYALLEIDESSSGEHWGTGIFTENYGIVFQDESGFLSKLGKTQEEVFPYRYRCSVPLACYDIHVSEDGWSG